MPGAMLTRPSLHCCRLVSEVVEGGVSERRLRCMGLQGYGTSDMGKMQSPRASSYLKPAGQQWPG